ARTEPAGILRPQTHETGDAVAVHTGPDRERHQVEPRLMRRGDTRLMTAVKRHGLDGQVDLVDACRRSIGGPGCLRSGCAGGQGRTAGDDTGSGQETPTGDHENSSPRETALLLSWLVHVVHAIHTVVAHESAVLTVALITSGDGAH